MSETLPPAPAPDDGAPRAPSNTFELEEGREHFRFWMPRYVVGLFSEQLGQRGIALYASLAWWLCSDAPHHRPTLKEIGHRAGCSRSTVWRGLKELQQIGVIRITEQIGAAGRRAHKITLVHPEGAKEYELRHGAEFAGDVNLSARRAQSDHAERSNCARGALNLKPPSGSNLDPNVCVNTDTHTHARAVPPTDTTATEEIEIFSARWMERLAPGAPHWREQHEQESRWAAAELLRLGWTLAELLEALEAPERLCNEWPREFVARHDAVALKAARRSAAARRAWQTRSQTLERARTETARRMTMKERYDALSAERRAELEAEAIRAQPSIATRPGFVAMLALDLFAAQLGDDDSAPPAGDQAATAGDQASAQ